MIRLLVVVDDLLIRSLVATFLEHLGYEVDVATDLSLALESIRHTTPGGVLVFPHPIRLAAHAFLDMYRRQASVSGAPVALIVADIPDEPFGWPVTTVLRMPFSLDELAATVWDLVEAGRPVRRAP